MQLKIGYNNRILVCHLQLLGKKGWEPLTIKCSFLGSYKICLQRVRELSAPHSALNFCLKSPVEVSKTIKCLKSQKDEFILLPFWSHFTMVIGTKLSVWERKLPKGKDMYSSIIQLGNFTFWLTITITNIRFPWQ